MELKLKDEVETMDEQKDTPAKDDFSDLEEGAFRMTSMDVQHTDHSAMENSQGVGNGSIMKIVAIAIVLILGGLGVSILYNGFMKPAVDITSYAAKSESEIAAGLGLTFSDDEEIVAKIPQYTKGKVTARTSEDRSITIIYVDGKQKGIKLNNKKYSMFNVRISDPEYEATNSSSYNTEDSFNVINEIGGTAQSSYYCDKKKNTCFVLTVNGTSNRVVSITYYTDFRKMTEELEF